MQEPMRTKYPWHLRTRTLPLGERTLLMGILNLTPDSFSDGGLYDTPNHALDHAMRLLDQGADLLDLGAESTRPNATPLDAETERQRLLPVLEAILAARPATIVSVDTYHASTAQAALDAGAEIVNDVSGLTWDPAMAGILANARCGAILMHTRGTPQTWKDLPPLADAEVTPLVLHGLSKILVHAAQAGIAAERIMLDPGFGFGKLGQQNFALLAHLPRLAALDRPLLVGLSRKRFLTEHPIHPTEAERTEATSAAHVAVILAGAHILRVHDIPPARTAAAIADAILAAG